MKIKLLLYIISLSLLSSCVSKEKIIYLQGQQNSSASNTNYEPLIQNDDMLMITIMSKDQELAAPFNIDQLQGQNGNSNNSNLFKTTYLVDQEGFIDFPVIGKLKVSGFTKNYLKQHITDKLALYLTNPIINIRIVNYKVSISGEVVKPGVYSSNSERMTLLELISNAGDLTIYGRRDNILIIRDYLGTKTFNRVDITKADFVNSPFYYLDQNDLVYVEPRKAKIDSNGIIGSNVTTIVSLVSAFITTTILLTRL